MLLASSSVLVKASSIACASSAGTVPSAASFSAYSVRVVFSAPIALYISGWVKAGSSVSLWPWRRSDDVQHHVAAEGHAVFGGHTSREDDGFRVVAVDVQDGRLDRLGDVGAIEARISMRRQSGETDLVVHHQV